MALDPQVRHLEMMARPEYEMRFKSGGEFGAWQTSAREKLRELLGLPISAAEIDNFKIEWERTDDIRFDEIRFTFDSETAVTVSANLLLPKRAAEPLPLIICLQGHSKGAHISLGRPIYDGDEATIAGGDRDFALQIVEQGWAALALEQRAFGDRGGTPDGPACYQVAMQALLLGRTLIGERCFDTSRAIDMIIEHFPQIDPERIALMGQSGGGTVAIYEGALEERLCAVMSASAFCGYRDSIGAQHHCSCNYVPRILNYFDMGDLAGMVAPRPMVIVNGKDDTIFPLHAVNEQADIARALYSAAGAPDKFRQVVGFAGHRFYADLSWPVWDDVTGWGKAK